jgi:inner membrane protein
LDSITHIALGAIVGEAIAGKTLGKRALFLGAIAQSVPDIDFIAAFWLPAADNLLAHRGFTHSLLFGVLATLILAVLSERWHRSRKIPYTTWLLLFGVEIFIHLALDACNAYGVGWFEPFDHKRVSFHILFVADPFFSIWSGIALAALMILDSKVTLLRRIWIYAALTFTTAYLMYAIANKLSVDRETKAILEQRKISWQRFFSTPTPFNSWLWYVVAETDSGFHTGYRSVFDDGDLTIGYHPQQNHLLENLDGRNDVQRLLRFSQAYYTVEQRSDTLVFNDLRFGQIAGWENPDAPFVFHYYLNYPEANLMVIQRGRFSNWNRRTFRSMVRRIRGEH